MFRLFQFCKRTAGLYNADHKEQDEQRITNCLQGSVNVGNNIPNRAAFEILRGLRNELPDFAQFVIPDLKSVLKVLDNPVV